MITYTLYFVDEYDIRIIKKNGFREDVIPFNFDQLQVSVDLHYQEEKFGLPLSRQELNYFKAQFLIWNDLSIHHHKEWCIIKEEGVLLTTPAEQWLNLLADIPKETDVFFPF